MTSKGKPKANSNLVLVHHLLLTPTAPWATLMVHRDKVIKNIDAT